MMKCKTNSNSLVFFLNRRLDELSFELTKPSTGQEYKVARNKEKEEKRKNWGHRLEIQAQVVKS
jgi:hypothetical protein